MAARPLMNTRPTHSRARRASPLFAGAVALCVLVAACSGDDDASTTTASVVTNPPLDSTVDSTTVTTDSTTSSTITTTSTSTSTTSTTTIEAPATTEPPSTDPGEPLVGIDSPEAQAMVAAFDDFFAAFTAALRNPSDGALAEAVLARTTGKMSQTVQGSIDTLIERGQEARPGEVPTEYELSERSVTIFQDAGGLDACWIDGDMLVVPNGSPDGTDEVIDAGATSYDVSYGMTRVGDAWLVSSLQFFATYEDQVGCG